MPSRISLFQLLLTALFAALALLLVVTTTHATDARVAPLHDDASIAAAPAPTPTPRARAPRAPNALVVTFTYDNAGRLTVANYSSGKRITYAYDNSGDLTAMQTLANEMLFMPIILR